MDPRQVSLRPGRGILLCRCFLGSSEARPVSSLYLYGLASALLLSYIRQQNPTRKEHSIRGRYWKGEEKRAGREMGLSFWKLCRNWRLVGEPMSRPTINNGVWQVDGLRRGSPTRWFGLLEKQRAGRTRHSPCGRVGPSPPFAYTNMHIPTYSLGIPAISYLLLARLSWSHHRLACLPIASFALDRNGGVVLDVSVCGRVGCVY